MPAAFPPTVAEREAELLALQSAFDEYIASSRELEEELDGELAKMQEKLAESTAANSVLSAQLENIAPQLASLEAALTESRRKLKEEQKMRRAAEQAQDEADQRVREMEMALQTVREECDVVHEELAFKENELEETKLELEVEKQQLQNELSQARALLEQEQQDGPKDRGLGAVAPSAAGDPQPIVDLTAAGGKDAAASAADDAYVKKLEEELELVTEQLIETEKRMADQELSYQERITQVEQQMQNSSANQKEEESDTILRLQTETSDAKLAHDRLTEELQLTQQELALSKEEVGLQQEELQAAEEDLKAAAHKLEEERAKSREAINNLSIQLKETDVKLKDALGEAAHFAQNAEEAAVESAQFKEEIVAAESALTNAKKDYQQVCDELDAVHVRFDQAVQAAKEEGRDGATDELREAMKADARHEVDSLKQKINTLIGENKALQQKVDETALALAAAKDASGGGGGGGSSEAVNQLQSQLNRAKEESAKKDEEMTKLTTEMQERLTKAEEQATRLEHDCKAAKSKLAEAEAHLIVLKREKVQSDRQSVAAGSRGLAAAAAGAASAASSVGGSAGGGGSTVATAGSSMNANDPERARELAGLDRGRGSSQQRVRSRSSDPSSMLRLEYKLAEEAKKLSQLQKEYDTLLEQKRYSDTRVKRLEEDLRILQKELFTHGGKGDAAVVTQMSRLSTMANQDKSDDIINSQDTDGQRIKDMITTKNVDLMSKELISLDKKFNSQRLYNAQLLSKMLHLQGNIQVFCRIRPMSFKEIQGGSKHVVEALSETECGCFDTRTNKWKSFNFDRVWGPDQSQTNVFQDVEPLALSVVDGYNACIFAYGQTGSGKTFTMEGTAEGSQFGISYRTIQKVFHLLSLRAQQQRAAEMFVENEKDEEAKAEEVAFTFSLKIGMLEIYNEEIYDLLGSEGSSLAEKQENARQAGGKASLEIRKSKDGRIEVPNLTKEKVDTIDDVMQLLKRGNSNRSTAATDMNAHSSRSHMVLLVDVDSGVGETQRNKGTLFLVDLAGSERVRRSKVEGQELKEAGFINKSLSALGNVMEALDRKASHVPYRDSKLTYLLQDSVGGNSRTMMVVAICPTDTSFDESIHALQFATRVRRIQIGAAQRNVTSKNLEETVKALTEEMRNLTRAKERSENQLHTLKRDNARVQDKLQNLSKARSQNKSESKTLEVLKKNNDDMAARWQKEKNAREETSAELETSRKELRSVQQQLSKAQTKMNTLEQKVADKEHELDRAKKALQKANDEKSAAVVRARREQVMSSRTKRPVVSAPTPKAATKTAKSSTPAASTANGTPAKEPAATKAPPAETPKKEDEELPKDEGYNEIRSKVLALLEKYDKAKVSRIDIIMEKFTGKEELLLEKMTQRYEAEAASSAGGSSAGGSMTRNEMALHRHQERMKRIREKKGG